MLTSLEQEARVQPGWAKSISFLDGAEQGEGFAGRSVDGRRFHGDFQRPRLFLVGKPFFLLCGGESWR